MNNFSNWSVIDLSNIAKHGHIMTNTMIFNILKIDEHTHQLVNFFE